MLPTGPYSADRDPEFQRIMRRLRNARTKTVLHRETCPCCGAKLVNLYRKSAEDSMWKCKKCWDKHEAGGEVDIVEKAREDEDNISRCKTCDVFTKASDRPAICRWYFENVMHGDKSTKSCPYYKPVEGE